MRIAIVGAGGTGGYFGGLLSRAGEAVTFLARGAHLEAMQKEGLLLISPRFGTERVPVRATADAASVGVVDLVFVCVKTYDLRPALGPLGSLLGPKTVVLGVQNGVDDTALLAFGGERRVLGGVAQVVARRQGPGEIVHEALGTIVLGERFGEPTARVHAIAKTFRRAGIEATASGAMAFERWRKLIWIAAQSGLTTVTRRGLGPLLETDAGRALFKNVLEEAAAVARHEGIPDVQTLVEQFVKLSENLARSNPSATSSMCNDLLEGKRLELDAIQGDLLRRAARHGLVTPALLSIYVALLPFVEGSPRG